MDYLAFNISGYTFYAIYSSVGYFTNIKGAGTVVIADLIFIYHAIVMMSVKVIQCFRYEVVYRMIKRGKNRISGIALAIIIGLWTVVITENVLYIV